MRNYSEIKKEMLDAASELSRLILTARALPGLDGAFLSGGEQYCSRLPEQVAEEVIRVAVVGPIKSGKSTFINSLLTEDYLKRGAGVVTSIVTRIRGGPSLRGVLTFKTWEEVNADIERAMAVLPPQNRFDAEDGIDIRRENDRERIERMLGTLAPEHQISNDTRNAGSLLLGSYLAGYDTVKQMAREDDRFVRFEGEAFPEHRKFAGADALSVYLNDIRLEIPSERLNGSIEIADCQGSDSPNPHHLAMIQNYLFSTHLILYIVSSRTGVRQADIKFLTMVRKMGILEHALFIVNVDLGEHEGLEDLQALVERVRGEVGLLKADPEVYTLSALYHLFKSRKESLAEKDRLRLAQWEREEGAARFSEREMDRFISDFTEKLARERNILLLGNHLERVGLIASTLLRRLGLSRGLLSRDAASAGELMEKMARHQEQIEKTKAVMKGSLEGSIQKLKKELKTEVDRFFDFRNGPFLKRLTEFIRNYSVSYADYEESLATGGLSGALFRIFQDFKQRLDSYMAEYINPEILRFIKEEEEKIRSYLNSVGESYEALVQDALGDLNRTLAGLDVRAAEASKQNLGQAWIDAVKQREGLTPPSADASLQYTTGMKTETFMRFGFYSILNLIKRILRNSAQEMGKQGIRALKGGVARMKRETEKSVAFHLKDYRENLKFQYLSKLVDTASDNLYEIVADRFHAYAGDLSKVLEEIDRRQIDKEKAIEDLKKMEADAANIAGGINRMKREIGLAV